MECFFDKESITWGANWVVELEKGIDSCDTIVIILSPDYCKSEWALIERTSSMADDPAGLKKKVRPLLLKPYEDLLPRFLKPIQSIDVSTDDKFEKQYPSICRELGGTLVEETHDEDRNKLPSIRDLPRRHRMPYRSLYNKFVGRVDDLWNIHDMLKTRRTTVVEGIGIVAGAGGIGKTQLAIEYVHRLGCHYPGGVFWIDAEQGTSAMISWIAQPADIEIDNTLQEKDQLLQLWNALARLQPVLIVLDNFPEDQPLQPWLPTVDSIHTLVTTRRRDLNHPRLSLRFMSTEEGIKLVNSGEREFGAEAEKLVGALGGLPLALELARNFLNIRPGLAIDGLLEEMKKMGEIEALDVFAEKYSDELPTGHVKEVAATFRMSVDAASPGCKGHIAVHVHTGPGSSPCKIVEEHLECFIQRRHYKSCR